MTHRYIRTDNVGTGSAWVHLGYFFGDQTKLRRAFTVALVMFEPERPTVFLC